MADRDSRGRSHARFIGLPSTTGGIFPAVAWSEIGHSYLFLFIETIRRKDDREVAKTLKRGDAKMLRRWGAETSPRILAHLTKYPLTV